MSTSVVRIPMNRGLFTIVDAADAERAAEYHWFAGPSRNGSVYAITCVYAANTKSTIRLHRLILDAPDGVRVDHRNGDTLDNRRANLRLCTGSQNNQNKYSANQRRGRFKGVYLAKGRWLALIYAGEPAPSGPRAGESKRIYLGFYSSAEEAARAYDAAARKYFGEFAVPNFPNPGEASDVRRI